MPSRLPKRLEKWFPFADASGARFGVDTLLILSIMDRESAGGEALRPKGPQGYGDGGRGHGLMQIDDRSHPIFCAERLPDRSPAWADPARNIEYGARILSDCIVAMHGDEELACCAYNAGVAKVRKALLALSLPATPARRYAAANAVTTGGDYGRDVIARRDLFRSRMFTPKENT